MQPTTVEVVFVRDLQRTHRFYTALGFVLKEENHDNGPIHYSVAFGGMIVEFYPTKSTAVAPPPAKSRLLIVEVEHFDHVLRTCSDMDLEREPVEYYDRKRNLRSMCVHDPDDWRVRILEVVPEAKPSIH